MRLLLACAVSSVLLSSAAFADCDVNRDGDVLATDALIVLRASVGIPAALDTCSLLTYGYLICDVNQDDEISATDALIVIRYAVGAKAPDCTPIVTTTTTTTTTMRPPTTTTTLPVTLVGESFVTCGGYDGLFDVYAGASSPGILPDGDTLYATDRQGNITGDRLTIRSGIERVTLSGRNCGSVFTYISIDFATPLRPRQQYNYVRLELSIDPYARRFHIDFFEVTPAGRSVGLLYGTTRSAPYGYVPY